MGQLCSGPKKSVNLGVATDSIATVYSPAGKRRDSNCSDATGVGIEANTEVIEDEIEKEVYIEDIEVLPMSPEQARQIAVSETNLVKNTSKFRIKLVPHVHTAFCERKERVCSSVGKTQQGETLVVRGIQTPLVGCCWLRSSPTNHTSFRCIDGSFNSEKYILTEEDLDCYIAFQHSYSAIADASETDESAAVAVITADDIYDTTKEVTSHCCVIRTNIAGPITPGPPRIVSLRITGTMKAGDFAIAAAEYIGGKQGASEYWWYQIKNGKRNQLTKPNKIKNAAALDISSDIDPRVYRITDDDIGCVLKVKCRPFRIDGYAGEVFTSKPSSTITAKKLA